MCGRFVGYRNLEELQKYFPIDRTASEVVANYNVAPSQEVLAIVKRDDVNWLDKFHWGLVPFWAKDVSIGNKLINARAETVDTKPSFRNAFKARRCLIPADGFYEWKGAKGKKQPVYLTLPDKEPFAFAGLWEEWIDKGSGGPAYRSCTILTTAASDSVKSIHHRMPVILKPDKYHQWLNTEYKNLAELKDIMAHWKITELIGNPVSKQVNSASNNDPSNIKPLTQTQIEF